MLLFRKRFQKKLEISKILIEEINKKKISSWGYKYNDAYDVYYIKSKGIRYFKQKNYFYNEEFDLFVKVKEKFGFTNDVIKNLQFIIDSVDKRIKDEEKEYINNSKNDTEKKVKIQILKIKKKLRERKETLHFYGSMPDGCGGYKRVSEEITVLENQLKDLEKLI